MTVRQLLDNVDSCELSEWSVYFKIENEKSKTGETENKMPVEDKIKTAFRFPGAKV